MNEFTEKSGLLNLMHLSFRHFSIVETIAASGSVIKAAKVLGISQPALSSALQKLEQQIGEKLFDRNVKPLRATRFARVFIDRGKQIAFERDEILRDINRLKGLQSGKLTVATGMFAAEGSVEQAISRVVTLFPHLQIELLQIGWQKITESVIRGTTDLAVIELGLAETIPELETELVNGSPCFFFCRADHPLAKQETVTWNDLNVYPFAGNRLAARIVTHLNELNVDLGEYDKEGKFVTAKILVETYSALMRVIKTSNAFGMTSPKFLKNEIAAGKIVLLDPGPHTWMTTRYGFVYRKDRHLSPALKMFMETVRTIEQENAESS